MQEAFVCQCPVCRQSAAHPDKANHRRMNLLLSRMSSVAGTRVWNP